MIQEYLNSQLIKTTDDANFEKLKKTCADIAKKIAKDKAKILAYSLVAFDPEISADNKEIVEIKNQIIENWQTFLSNSTDTAVTIIRAIMLDALQASSKETSSASVIWFANRNAFKYFKLGREKDILTAFLLTLGNKVEAEISERWNFSPDNEIEIPKVTAATLDDSDFTAGFTQVTVKEATNKALKKQITELRDNQKKFADQVCLMQMRTQLLWWKEAGYSPLQKVSYKKMKDGQLQMMLAHDYCNFIPEMYPVSADYFLAETHKGLSANTEKKMKISEFLKMVEQNASSIKNAVSELSGDEGRVSLADFVNGVVHGKYRTKQFKDSVGVSDTTEMTLSEITLWLFHDLHSVKLATSK